MWRRPTKERICAHEGVPRTIWSRRRNRIATQFTRARHARTLLVVVFAVAAAYHGEHIPDWASSAMAATPEDDGDGSGGAHVPDRGWSEDRRGGSDDEVERRQPTGSGEAGLGRARDEQIKQASMAVGRGY